MLPDIRSRTSERCRVGEGPGGGGLTYSHEWDDFKIPSDPQNSESRRVPKQLGATWLTAAPIGSAHRLRDSSDCFVFERESSSYSSSSPSTSPSFCKGP